MTPEADPWSAVCAARLPAAAVAALAPLRRRTDIRVFPQGECVWVRWSAPCSEVVRALLPVAGVAFFAPTAGRWHRFQHRLPSAEAPPEGEGRVISSLLNPAPFEPHPVEKVSAAPLPLRIVHGGPVKPATALACQVRDLEHWADRATSKGLEAIRAARSGSRALLLGVSLPSISDSVRYWGADLLMPLGFRPEPDLPDAVIRDAAGAGADELVLLDERGAERIPRSAFRPLARAALRLAIREGGAA